MTRNPRRYLSNCSPCNCEEVCNHCDIVCMFVDVPFLSEDDQFERILWRIEMDSDWRINDECQLDL